MATSELQWIDFWDMQNIFGDRLLVEKNMSLFVKKTGPILEYRHDDCVLDIGCGLGFLAHFIKDQVREVHGVDPSQRAIALNRIAFAGAKNVFFYPIDPARYTDFSFLAPQKFSLIICQSVVQYYRDMSEIDALILSLKKLSHHGARMIISDLPRPMGILTDVMAGLQYGARHGYLWPVLKSYIQARFSAYQEIRTKRGMLTFTAKLLKDLQVRLNLDADILTKRITTNRARYHLLIRF